MLAELHCHISDLVRSNFVSISTRRRLWSVLAGPLQVTCPVCRESRPPRVAAACRDGSKRDAAARPEAGVEAGRRRVRTDTGGTRRHWGRPGPAARVATGEEAGRRRVQTGPAGASRHRDGRAARSHGPVTDWGWRPLVTPAPVSHRAAQPGAAGPSGRKNPTVRRPAGPGPALR